MVDILPSSKFGRRRLRDDAPYLLWALATPALPVAGALKREAELTNEVQQATPTATAPAASPPPAAGQPEPEAENDNLDLVETTLRGRYRNLRFPEPLERAFHDESAAARRRHLMLCAAIGLSAYWLAALTDSKLAPDISELISANRLLLTALIGISVLIGHRWRSDYRVLEWLTTINAVIGAVVIVWMACASTTLSAKTHSATILGVSLYAALVARQRFRFTLVTALVVMFAFLVFVQGNTPDERLIVATNGLLVCASTIYGLLANYTFEYQERTEFLLKRRDTYQRAALARTNDRLHELSMRDPLTGLRNRRQFEADFAAGRSGAMALLLMDVDFFKLFNDGYGHPSGDHCLKQIAAALEDIARREQGFAARLGGEEFALLLPDRDLAAATAVGESLRAAIQRLRLPHLFSPIAEHVSVSIGVSYHAANASSGLDLLLASADVGLYRAKHAGRNRVVANADSPTVAATPGAAISTPLPHRRHAPQNPMSDATSDPDSAAALQAPTAKDKLLDAALRHGVRWMRFTPKFETLYQQQTAAGVKRRLIIANLGSIAILNLCAMAGRRFLPDIAERYVHAELWLTLLFLATTVVIALPIGRRLREWVYTFGAIAMSVTCPVILGHSHAALICALPPSFFLITMYSVIAAKQPFWQACLTAALTIISVPIFMRGVSPMEQLILNDDVVQLFTLLLFTVITAHAIESRARRNYLLDQLDTRQEAQLIETREQLQKLSMLDPLTGIRNRRHFEADFTRIWDESCEDRKPLSLLIIDIDFFKLYNDGYGHPAGDACLKQIAQLLEVVAGDARGTAVRLGGEEFGLLLPNQDLIKAYAVGERVCQTIRSTMIPHRHSAVAEYITVSLGVATMYPAPATDSRVLLINADTALYRAKSLGRDRVIAYVEAAADPAAANITIIAR